jgi:hypothetical protein
VRFLFRPPAGPAAALLDLPWTVPLADWSDDRIAVPYRSLGRRVVRFVSDGETLYVLKELPESAARGEYLALTQLADAGLPAVRPQGVVVQRGSHTGAELDAILVTRYADGTVPVRALLSAGAPVVMPPAALVDALAVLLVRLHARGFAWPECSPSAALVHRSGVALVLAAGTVRRGLTESARLAGVRQAHNLTGVELLDVENRGVLRAGIDPIELAGELPRRYHARWSGVSPAASWRVRGADSGVWKRLPVRGG